MASAQVVETSVHTNNSPSQDYTTNPDDHSNHNIDSPAFKPFTVILRYSAKLSLQPPMLRSLATLGNCSFLVGTPKVWNKLPTKI